MTNAEKNIPDWAALEREQDQAWIRQNLAVFWQTAVQGSLLAGRGALVVDVTARPLGEGNLFAYFNQEQVERFQNEQIDQFVQVYAPEEEFVIILLKPESRISSYRIRTFPLDDQSQNTNTT